MKTILTLSVVLLTTILCCVAGGYGTAFTYQGRLNQAGVPANGVYQMTFYLCDTPSTGGQLANFPSVVPVSNGLFSVEINFGDLFNADGPRWLEIEVRTNLSSEITTLTPRQLITSTPYAIRAFNVDAAGLAGPIPSSSLSGTYTSSVTFDNAANNYSGTFYGSFLGLSFIGGSFAGSFIGNGSGLANLNGSQILSGTIPSAALNNAWRPVGNSGTIPGTHFIGTTDNRPLEFRINNQRVLHIGTNANGAPNLVAGSPANSITGTNTEGSTIAGGGIGLYPNTITASYATIGGGTFHIVNGTWSTIAGGRDNIVQADHSTVGGGHGNVIRPSFGYASILGGAFNGISTNAYYSAIGGGYLNNVARESYSATIAGGLQNDIGVNSGYSVIGGGYENNIANDSLASTIAGGFVNDISTNAFASTVSGGYDNNIASDSSSAVIGGGAQNIINANAGSGTISGGFNNRIGNSAVGATIAGGSDHNINNNSTGTTIGGGSANIVGFNSSYATIAGGTDNQIASARATISGGNNNSIGFNSTASVIAGGDNNNLSPNSTQSVVGGGSQNHVASNSVATIGGGFRNQIGGAAAPGVTSLFPSQGNTVAGGSGNFVSDGARGATIGGGNNNTVLTNGDFAMIPGGEFNDATNYAFAAGRLARANHQGAFVWADSTFASIASLGPNSVTMRASGGYRLFSNSGATAGVSLAPGGTAWAVISDRNAKKDFAAVDSRAILEKLAALPITQWHYNWEASDATPHIGPMAQDFKAAFYPGRDDKSITTQEADGVALVAIQGLNEKLEVRSEKSETRIQKLEAENAELKSRLEQIEKFLRSRS